jgi:hypothetical protein
MSHTHIIVQILHMFCIIQFEMFTIPHMNATGMFHKQRWCLSLVIVGNGVAGGSRLKDANTITIRDPSRHYVMTVLFFIKETNLNCIAFDKHIFPRSSFVCFKVVLPFHILGNLLRTVVTICPQKETIITVIITEP